MSSFEIRSRKRCVRSSFSFNLDLGSVEDSKMMELPVLWYAPFLSGGGYSSEAISFALQLDLMIPSFGIVSLLQAESAAVRNI